MCVCVSIFLLLNVLNIFEQIFRHIQVSFLAAELKYPEKKNSLEVKLFISALNFRLQPTRAGSNRKQELKATSNSQKK